MRMIPTLGFKGGVHPPDYKQTRDKEIKKLSPKGTIVIPLIQHIGAPCEPLVKKGDKVKKGQKIGEAKAYVSSPVHTSVSGQVKKIHSYPHPMGGKAPAVEVELDREDETAPLDPPGDVELLSRDELLERIKEAGIVGMGGAGFPTHVKLNPPQGKEIDTFILNGAECEPYLTSDFRLMLEETEKIVKGMELITRILEVENVYVGIEDNKPEAVQSLKEVVTSPIQVVELPTKYPQGWEKALIYILTGREVPAGGLPLDVGVVVHNVGTAKAIYDAIYEGKPLIERVVTVAGWVAEPGNFSVGIGTTWGDLIEECGGYQENVVKLIGGGPMMGIAQYSDEVPVIKGTSGVLVQDTKGLVNGEPDPCIKCGRCVDVCPMELLPTSIAESMKQGQIEEAQNLHAMDCCECGCCTYVCPSRIPLVQWIKQAKGEIEMA